MDGDTITFENVSQSDTQVVQCNATNKHGSIFANVYMTVRGETIMQLIVLTCRRSVELKCVRFQVVPSITDCWLSTMGQMFDSSFVWKCRLKKMIVMMMHDLARWCCG